LSNSPPLSATAASPGFGGSLAAWLASPVERRLFNYFKAFFALKLYLGPILGLGPDGALPSLASLAHAASSGPSLILLLACVITIASPAHYKFGLWIFLVRGFSFIPLALTIALISGETDFAMTNLACLLLLFPRQVSWSYPTAYLAILVIHYSRILGASSG